MYRRLIGELARLFTTAPENVDLFGVQNNGAGGVDVRYAAHGSPYYRAEKMDGLLAQNRKRVRRAVAWNGLLEMAMVRRWRCRAMEHEWGYTVYNGNVDSGKHCFLSNFVSV